MIRIFFALLCLSTISAQAADLDMQAFRQIPVLHEGRIKPLDSFARIYLKAFSGKLDQNPSEFLAEALFDPETSIQRPLFRIDSINLRRRLGLEDRALYNFADLAPALQKTSPQIASLLAQKPQDLTIEEKDFLTLQDNALAYLQILRSFSLVLPLDVTVPEKYRKSLTPPSYLDLQKIEQNILADLRKITARKGDEIKSYTPDEKRTALLAYQINIINRGGTGNHLFQILPPVWQDHNWHAPWDVLDSGAGGPQTAELLKLWSRLGMAAIKHDSKNWTETADKLLKQSLSLSKFPAWRLQLEVLYNQFHIFDLSVGMAFGGFILCLLYFTFNKSLWRKSGLFFLATAALLQTAGLGTRIALLMRPPVGTLYESLLFVTLLVMLIGLFFEWRAKSGMGLLLGSLAGAAIGLLAFSFANEGDSLTLLSAVLNTKFWLATHVLCITTGYAWCIVAGLLAHVMLIKPALTKNLIAPLHTLAILALLFTAVGTILGGIWADQSWGRFWGWDPKENGALLATLWLIWLVHGKLGGQINDLAFTAGMAGLNIIVALSWIGVNLLGVGLHSYGFTDGVFAGFALFLISEIIMIAALWLRNTKE